MKSIRPIRPKKKLASFISNAIVTALGILIITVLFQSYQISSRLITQEANRTSRQTSNLIQSLFNFRLETLQIHQDSSAKNITLVQEIHSGSEEQLDQYFLAVDQVELSNAPDIRFIASRKEVLWEDGNSQFYGIDPQELDNIVRKVSISNSWHVIKTPARLNPIYLLVRRSAIVDSFTGELLGFLYVSVVLNDNYALIETIKDSSHVQNLILAVDKTILASTFTGSELFNAQQVIQSPNENLFDNQNLVSKINLVVEGVPTYLSMFSVQSNLNALKLRDNYYFWIIFIVVAMVLVTVITRWWLHRRIKREIDLLMSYTHRVAVQGKEHIFQGSRVYEFDHFGRTLENTFQRIAEQEKQLEDLFNFSISPIILWSTEGYIIRMNPTAEKEFIGEIGRSKKFFHELERQLLPHINSVVNGDTSAEFMTNIDDKVFRWSLSPIAVENRIESIVAQGQDVTSFAEAEKQSQIARREAEESARVRADFLAKMSHELRTPLNGILGVTQLLKRSVSTEEQREQVNVLCSSGEHLLAVLNDILDFSKIEEGKFVIQRSEFYLNDVLSAIEQIYRPICQEKQLTFELESDIEDGVLVSSSQTRLNQVLYNIINNSLKFTHEGAIHIRMSLQYGAPDLLRVVITDTGIGINETDLNIIFEPFMQAESTNTREYGGSGLGLSIVRSLVELLDGTIQVQSEVGKGTEFSICLPIEVVSRRTVQAIEKNEEEQFALFDIALNVLLVEDNHTNAFIAQAFCKKYGMIVDWVTDGVQAINKVKERSYDLILMDNQLPFLDGIDATTAIKKEMKVKTPVFACTADGMESTQKAFFAAGAEYVIVKPIREESLNKALMYLKENYIK